MQFIEMLESGYPMNVSMFVDKYLPHDAPYLCPHIDIATFIRWLRGDEPRNYAKNEIYTHRVSVYTFAQLDKMISDHICVSIEKENNEYTICADLPIKIVPVKFSDTIAFVDITHYGEKPPVKIQNTGKKQYYSDVRKAMILITEETVGGISFMSAELRTNKDQYVIIGINNDDPDWLSIDVGNKQMSGTAPWNGIYYDQIKLSAFSCTRTPGKELLSVLDNTMIPYYRYIKLLIPTLFKEARIAWKLRSNKKAGLNYSVFSEMIKEK